MILISSNQTLYFELDKNRVFFFLNLTPQKQMKQRLTDTNIN